MAELLGKIEAFPLLDFFTELMRYDNDSLKHKGLTFDEYLLGLKTLGQGVGLANEDELYSICKLLWLKPYHSEKAFEELFSRYRLHMKTKIKELSHRTEGPIEEANKAGESMPEGRQGSEGEGPLPELPSNNGDENLIDGREEEEKEMVKKEKIQAPHTFRTVYVEYAGEEGGNGEAIEIKSEEKIAEEVYRKSYILRGDYFTLKARKLEQNYQMVRTEVLEGRKDTILWEETIDKVAREGYFSELVLAPSKKRKTMLNLLIDYSDSMIAFHGLCENMAASLKRYSPRQNQVFYFFNYSHVAPSSNGLIPETAQTKRKSSPLENGLLFENTQRTKAISLESFCSGGSKSIMIVSDAGAARGKYRMERAQRTQFFLNRFQRHKVVWLNPMPRERWIGTSAEYISGMVDMYELNEKEFPMAMKKLKLKYRPPGAF